MSGTSCAVLRPPLQRCSPASTKPDPEEVRIQDWKAATTGSAPTVSSLPYSPPSSLSWLNDRLLHSCPCRLVAFSSPASALA